MFAYIEGKLTEKTPTHIVVDAQGVGYLMHISLHSFEKFKMMDTARVLVHFIVREDAQILYGFADEDERKLFRLLISVSGVGANTARILLSSLHPSELVTAISSGNEGLLKKVKGIGAKTAQRIIVDLRDKVLKESGISGNLDISYNTRREEALSGLVVLGFGKVEAEKALSKIQQQMGIELPVEQLIREALKIL
ncbi:MAG: Holliday junction branch migration protein RuvA [Bacteroidales bacterium]|jgi:Holliday junction DNA helicase RuvA|nr:Holliday junction branch migration protein RuvA [Bacteroidales bacterium]